MPDDEDVIVCFTDGMKETFHNVDDYTVTSNSELLFLRTGKHNKIFNWNHVRYVARKRDIEKNGEE